MRAWVMGLAAVILLSETVAAAPPDPPRENHYKVYRTNTFGYAKPLRLTDQFGTSFTTDYLLEKFANPAEKRIECRSDGPRIHQGEESYPPVDPMVHQTWWRLNPPLPQPGRIVIGIDQFYYGQWKLRDAVFLLNPALKNVQGEPPTWNHYLCYDAVGPLLNKTVILTDQFGSNVVVVLEGKYFCNPVEKQHLDDGTVYPILDAKAHLACYQVQNPYAAWKPSLAVDQFGEWQLQSMYAQDCLCVPALKEHAVRAEESTWGKIKALYN